MNKHRNRRQNYYIAVSFLHDNAKQQAIVLFGTHSFFILVRKIR